MNISVALCTYNGEKFLERQLYSILNQTTKVTEIVICDDCSSDATLHILNNYQTNYPNLFKIYSNESNLKSNKNFEKALGLTTGDFIFFSDQDDLWQPNKVEKTIEVFNSNKNIEGVFSNAALIDENDKIVSNSITLWDTVGFFEKELIKPIDYLKFLLLNGNFVTGATLCIKKSVKEFCFPFETNEHNLYHDHWLALLLAEKNALACLNDTLISYRLHQQQQVGTGNIEERYTIQRTKEKELKMILGFYVPTKFNDLKLRTTFIYHKYIHHKNNFDPHYSQLVNKKIEQDLLKILLASKKELISKFPIKYYYRKLKNKIKNDDSLNFKI